MVREILSSIWDIINLRQRNVYGLADIYDDLVNDGYFDYSATAAAIQMIIGTRRREVLELAIGSGNLAVRLAKSHNLSGVDRCPEMIKLLIRRFQNVGLPVELQENNLTDFKFKKGFDCIYLHSADPMIFWDKNGSIELAINSRDELNRILINIHKHLKPNGKLLINIEKERSNFSPIFDANLFVFNIDNEGTIRKIYEIFDKRTGKVYLHATQKEKPCSIVEVNTIFGGLGYSEFQTDEDELFAVFVKK